MLKIDNLLPSSEACTTIGIVIVSFELPPYSDLNPQRQLTMLRQQEPPPRDEHDLRTIILILIHKHTSVRVKHAHARAGERVLAGEEAMSAEKGHQSAADSRCRMDIVSMGKIGGK